MEANRIQIKENAKQMVNLQWILAIGAVFASVYYLIQIMNLCCGC